MNGKSADVCIVEIEVAERGAIGEGSQVSCRPPIGANDGRRAGDRKRDFAADADWPLVPCAHPTANGIDHMRLHPLDCGVVEVFVAQAIGIGGEPIRQRPFPRV